MDFLSSAAALAAYRRNEPDEAARLAELILARDPLAAEAHLAKALLALKRDAGAEAIASLKACLAGRSAEWILDGLRTWGLPALRRETGTRVGAFLRSNLGGLGPPLTPEQRRADHDFINVVGSSYVRSFGGSPAFFPLFIGMGPTMLLTSDAAAAITRRKTRENLKRLDGRRNTLLILGADPYYYATDLQKAQAARPGQKAIPEDLAAMDAIAERHRSILEDAQKLVSGTLMLLGTTPTNSLFINEISLHLNVRLRALCGELGVTYVDWWDELVDRETGLLRADLAANAYPGDVHFTLASTKRFMELLKADGMYGPEVEPSASYEWTHVFECAVDASEKTRIWCEPSVTPKNAIQSNKVAAAHLAGHLADLLTCLFLERAGQTAVMLNVRDGFLPTAIPPQVQSGLLAYTDTPDNLQVAQQVMDFYGRTDVQLALGDDLSALDGAAFSRVVMLIWPDTAEADEACCREALGRLSQAGSVVVGTPFPDRIDSLGFGNRSKLSVNVSNRHIPERWRDYSLVVVR